MAERLILIGEYPQQNKPGKNDQPRSGKHDHYQDKNPVEGGSENADGEQENQSETEKLIQGAGKIERLNLFHLIAECTGFIRKNQARE